MAKIRRKLQWAVDTADGRQRNYSGKELVNVMASTAQAGRDAKEGTVLTPVPGMLPFFSVPNLAGICADGNCGIHGLVAIESPTFGNRVCGFYGGDIFFQWIYDGDYAGGFGEHFDRLQTLNVEGVPLGDVRRAWKAISSSVPDGIGFSYYKLESELAETGLISGIVRFTTDNRRVMWVWKDKIFTWDFAKDSLLVGSVSGEIKQIVSGNVVLESDESDLIFRLRTDTQAAPVYNPATIVGGINGEVYSARNYSIPCVVDPRSGRAELQVDFLELLPAEYDEDIAIRLLRDATFTNEYALTKRNYVVDDIRNEIDVLGNVSFDLIIPTIIGQGSESVWIVRVILTSYLNDEKPTFTPVREPTALEDPILTQRAAQNPLPQISEDIIPSLSNPIKQFKWSNRKPTVSIIGSLSQVSGQLVRIDISGSRASGDGGLQYLYQSSGDSVISISDEGGGYASFRVPTDAVIGSVKFKYRVYDNVLLKYSHATFDDAPEVTVGIETRNLVDNSYFYIFNKGAGRMEAYSYAGVGGSRIRAQAGDKLAPTLVPAGGTFTEIIDDAVTYTATPTEFSLYGFRTNGVHDWWIYLGYAPTGRAFGDNIPQQGVVLRYVTYNTTNGTRTSAEEDLDYNQVFEQISTTIHLRSIFESELVYLSSVPIIEYDRIANRAFQINQALAVSNVTIGEQVIYYFLRDNLNHNILMADVIIYELHEREETDDDVIGSNTGITSETEKWLRPIPLQQALTLPTGYTYTGLQVDENHIWVSRRTDTTTEIACYNRTTLVEVTENLITTITHPLLSVDKFIATAGSVNGVARGITVRGGSYMVSDQPYQLQNLNFNLNIIPPVELYIGQTNVNITLPHSITITATHTLSPLLPDGLEFNAQSLNVRVIGTARALLAKQQYTLTATVGEDSVTTTFDLSIIVVPQAIQVYPPFDSVMRNVRLPVWVRGEPGLFVNAVDNGIVLGSGRDVVDANGLVQFEHLVQADPVSGRSVGGLLLTSALTPDDSAIDLADEEFVECVWTDRYFVVLTRSGQFFHSRLDNEQESPNEFQIERVLFDQLDSARADDKPDKKVGLSVHRKSIYVFGEYSVERWYHSGGADFAFSRDNSFSFDYGCVARDTIQNVKEGIVFLSTNNSLLVLSGARSQRISTETQEYDIGRCNRYSARGMHYIEEGHTYYMLCLPFSVIKGAGIPADEWKIWVIDLSSGRWHQYNPFEDASVYTRITTLPAIRELPVPTTCIEYRGRNLWGHSNDRLIRDRRLDWRAIFSNTILDGLVEWHKLSTNEFNGFPRHYATEAENILILKKQVVCPMIYPDGRPFRMWDVQLQASLQEGFIGRDGFMNENPFEANTNDGRIELETSDDGGSNWESYGRIKSNSEWYRWSHLGRSQRGRLLRFTFYHPYNLIQANYSITVDRAYGN